MAVSATKTCIECFSLEPHENSFRRFKSEIRN